MITNELMDKYTRLFPEDRIFCSEDLGSVCIRMKNGELLVEPDDETEASFLDRLNRCIEKGVNLFHEEWEKIEIFYNDDEDY
ncbi:MAG: hypothetical protein IJJ44_07400 [Solobacterium sp.]|nr:hypothetical protein [Solobacterium sp.]